MPHQPQRRAQLFAGCLDQVREARRFLAGVLDGCPSAGDTVLAGSELAATCALRSASSRPGGTFTIAAGACDGDHVRIQARDDRGPGRRCGYRDGRPRGLGVAASLAAGHGVSGDPLTGSTTWADLPGHPAPPPSPDHQDGQPDDRYR